MNLYSLTRLVSAAEEHHEPETHHWLFPETAEIIYGGIAFFLVMVLFWKLGVFKMAAKALSDRTAKVQKDLDDSAAARNTAQGEAQQIRQAAGDIESERARLLAEAEADAAALIVDSRARIDDEIAELEARAVSDIAAAAGRSGDELHAEIARLSGAVTERLVPSVLDDAAQNELIEAFIARVGASS